MSAARRPAWQTANWRAGYQEALRDIWGKLLGAGPADADKLAAVRDWLDNNMDRT